MDESIATVDENGYVKGVAPGETTVVAEIDGKTAVCTVNVAEKQFNYLILIIPGALILLTAVGVLIVVAVKRKNKKTLVPCENGQHRKSAFCGRLKVVSGNQFGQEYSLDSQNENLSEKHRIVILSLMNHIKSKSSTLRYKVIGKWAGV